MEIIDYKDIKFIDNDIYNYGSYGSIKRCILNDKLYICKEFNDLNYLNGKRRKLDLLGDIDKKEIYTPKFWVKNNNLINSYLCDFFDGKDICAVSDRPIEEKISVLKKAKQSILTMHDIGIIHSDLIDSNIMYDNDNSIIIDFDNCNYKKYKTNIVHTNDYSSKFISKYGVIKELDIFIFNLLTFSILNDRTFFMSINDIFLNEYGIFDSKDSKKICNSLLLEKSIPNKSYLIDTIDETNIKI